MIALFPVVKRSKILLFRNFREYYLYRFRWKSGAEHTRELSRLPIYYKKRVQIKNFREFLVLEGRESTPSTWLFSLSTILIRCKNFEEFWRFEHRNSVWNASSNSKRHSRNPPCFIPRVIHSKILLFVQDNHWWTLRTICNSISYAHSKRSVVHNENMNSNQAF